MKQLVTLGGIVVAVLVSTTNVGFAQDEHPSQRRSVNQTQTPRRATTINRGTEIKTAGFLDLFRSNRTTQSRYQSGYGYQPANRSLYQSPYQSRYGSPYSTNHNSYRAAAPAYRSYPRTNMSYYGTNQNRGYNPVGQISRYGSTCPNSSQGRGYYGR